MSARKRGRAGMLLDCFASVKRREKQERADLAALCAPTPSVYSMGRGVLNLRPLDERLAAWRPEPRPALTAADISDPARVARRERKKANRKRRAARHGKWSSPATRARS